MKFSILSNNKKDTFEELYEMFSKDCFYIAKKYLKNDTLAEDAVHDAFVSLYEKRIQYENLPFSELQPLIVSIVKNKCKNMLLQHKKVADVSFDDIIIFQESKEIPVEEQILKNDERIRIKGFLNKIDEPSRKALQMKYIHDMSYNQIANAMNTNPKNIEVRLYRAKQKIRRIMQKEGYNN
jgi:RNA polymerase sigma-70 factor (ECF subfamily)